ncbi:glycosyltransferase family protein [Rickettsia rhipicephali]|nr:hypothetical protein [Rickettsia rhipicephali]
MHGLKSVFGVIPWFDYGIQKIIKNTNISIFNWIPRSSRGMTEVESLHKTRSTKNHSLESQIFHNEEKALPVYTVLVLLYKELSKLRSIIKNISLINYPKDKLGVKIIIEDDDYLMIKEIVLYNLPSYFHVISVPKSLPRTKPKALNYALEYSRGEYLVVYDAEDKPEQLLKALAMLKNLPLEYACCL